MTSDMFRDIEARAMRLHGAIVGIDPVLQSAVIAHLLATWIAGHRHPNIKQRDDMRAELLQRHMQLVRDLIPMEDARLDSIQQRQAHDDDHDEHGRRGQ